MAPVEPAVNRETSEGNKYSQEERIQVFNAMKAVTIDAARALNLENEICSLKKHNTASFTILDKNSFKIKFIKK